MPSIFQLAESISPVADGQKFFQPAQLIKHILGLMVAYKNDKSKFRFQSQAWQDNILALLELLRGNIMTIFDICFLGMFVSRSISLLFKKGGG